MKYKVIDNFLDEEYFDSLVTLFGDNKKKEDKVVPWFFQTAVANSLVVDNLFYMTHMLYEDNAPRTESGATYSYYNYIIPLLEKLEVKCVIRVKANLYPHTETIHEHPMHVDMNYSHSGAILSLNTCDGYTKLKDGTKIDSVANRVLLFDASNEHCSTTTTNVSARINININYIREQSKGTN